MRFPRMIWAGVAVLALDLVSLSALVVNPGAKFAALLFQLGTFLGAWGGMEALHWVATGSPWKLKGLEGAGGGGLAERMREIPWTDGAWLRSAVLRLLSGAVLAFAFCLLPLLYFTPPAWALVPYLLLLLQAVRLAAAGVSAFVMAPILLFLGGDRPATDTDRFHAFLAGGVSLALVILLWFHAGRPPLDQYLGGLAMVALNPAEHAYALLIGGIAWWKLCWVSRWMGRES